MEKETLYFKGDLAEYTGNTLYVDITEFYEIRILEGFYKGNLAHTVRKPNENKNIFKITTIGDE